MLRRRAARGERVRALEERPELTEWQLFAFEAFQLLVRDRQIGMAMGPIPWSAIDRFITSRLDRGWIDADEAVELEALILGLDNTDLQANRKPENRQERTRSR